MKIQEQTDYSRIATAIDYIITHFKTQPNLEEVAEKIALSPFHFQRLFTDWAGVSPKKFLQYITIAHAKKMLKENAATLFDAAFETIYKWQSKWISILVKPIFHTTSLMHYIVRLQDGKIVFLKFEGEKWVEVGEGATSRATACGEAIDNYYLCNVLS